MKRKIALCAAALAFVATGSGAALAQPVPPPYGAPVYPEPGLALPPYEVIAIVRSTGLEPLGRPLRQGPVYVLRAVDPGGQEVRVIVNAQMGRIVRIVPVLMPRHGVPVVRPPGRVAMVPDGYGPYAHIPGAEDAPLGGPPPGAVATMPHDPAAPSGPPLPRPRPRLASTDQPAANPAGTARPPAAQGEAKGKAAETTGTAARPAGPAPAPVEMPE